MDIRDSKLASDMLKLLYGLVRIRDCNYEESYAARFVYDRLADEAESVIKRAEEMGVTT